MKLIYYEFAYPRALADVLSNLLILSDINTCTINYDDYSEVHFDDYLIRINTNDKIIMFNTYEFENIISSIKNPNQSKKRKLNRNTTDFNNPLEIIETDLKRLLVDKKKKHNYKDANYISKRKSMQNSNRKYKTNTSGK